MICDKCKKDFSYIKWKSKETYKGIDVHHNPPEFISDYFKEKWSGEFYNLCRDCHVKLHHQIKKLLNKKAGTLKFINSEYWVMKRMSPIQIKESKRDIYCFTKDWLKKEEVKKDGDSDTII